MTCQMAKQPKTSFSSFVFSGMGRYNMIYIISSRLGRSLLYEDHLEFYRFIIFIYISIKEI